MSAAAPQFGTQLVWVSIYDQGVNGLHPGLGGWRTLILVALAPSDPSTAKAGLGGQFLSSSGLASNCPDCGKDNPSNFQFCNGSGVNLDASVTGLVLSVAGGGAPFVISQPGPQGTFGRISGGFTVPGGLVTYTSSFIAEIVRAGVQSVGRGQTEASRAVGLSAMSTLRNVTFPQALRVIVPPLISQYLNLTKNSSLAGAIGYSDLTNVAKTMTQTAPAVSIFILIMAAYLAMSLTYSLIGNLYNRHKRFTGS